MKELSGWGRYPRILAEERLSEDLAELSREVVLLRGLGRSYGDASLPPPGRVAGCTRLADRLISFDPETGVLRAEAGLSLAALNALFWPRGFASPVTPGTQLVTLGGMVASDVHGKNHHVAGCFGEHVRALRMRVADGRILEVSEAREPELFRATLGGMGLTGHILEVEFLMERIPSPWIWAESEQVGSLLELLGRLREASEQWPMTVCWVDCLRRGATMGRGIVMKGRWATVDEARSELPRFHRKLAVPFEFPEWVLCEPGLRAFNELYFRKHGAKTKRGVVHPYAFFYPLDAIGNWNRIYGRSGFVQYQCVLPADRGEASPRRFFDALTRLGGASFLSVIKDCGEQGKGILSFPKRGISVALDIPMRHEHTKSLVDTLNAIVIEEGGRIYLTKDALTSAEHFREMEPRLDAWNAVRRRWDPEGGLCSALSIRLLGDEAK